MGPWALDPPTPTGPMALGPVGVALLSLGVGPWLRGIGPGAPGRWARWWAKSPSYGDPWDLEVGVPYPKNMACIFVLYAWVSSMDYSQLLRFF